MEHYNDIHDELIGREEVAAVDEDMEKGVHLFSIYFYTSFCPNLCEE